MLFKRIEGIMNLFWLDIGVCDKQGDEILWVEMDKPNQIKKGLTHELKAINLGERVIVMGTTSKP
jgi:hypothetical protein